MLNRNNQKLATAIIAVTATILVFDIFTIITNIYIAPYLDGYGLPDILIFLKAIIFLTILIMMIVWKKNPEYHMSKDTLRTMMAIGFAVTFFYFFSLFMYKYLLLLDIADIIRNKILDGNPSLIYDFTTRNYISIRYINTIYGGFNSELFLGVELLALQQLIFKTKASHEVLEEKVKYDSFLFDTFLLPLSILYVISAFTSINLFQERYTVFESVMMFVSLTAFIFTIPSISAAAKIYSAKNDLVYRTHFVSWYRLLLLVSIAGIISFFALLGFHIYSIIVLQTITYRIITTIISIVIAILILDRTLRVLSLENK